MASGIISSAFGRCPHVRHSLLRRALRENEKTLCRYIHKTPIYFNGGNYKIPPQKIEKIKANVVSRVFRRIEAGLENKMPLAMKLYRIFMVGLKELCKDILKYMALSFKIKTNPDIVSSLPRKDIELYQSMAVDLKRVSPFLIISLLPFANYVIMPLAYKFPRQLLSTHFWTLQQRSEFALIAHKKRLSHQRGVFRGLQAQLDSKHIRNLPGQYVLWSRVLARLGSGSHPSPAEIIQCMPLFKGPPYHLDCLVPTHLSSLLRLNGLKGIWRWRAKMANHAWIIHEIDKAILSEGGVCCLTQDEMRWACFLRGLNPINMRPEDIARWLNKWMEVSQYVDDQSWSLLLHCPVLLAYNEPTNWAVLHS